jgi:hypothetical protein
MTLKNAAIVGAAVLLAGCSAGIKVTTDFDPQQDFSGYHTFVWAAPPQTGDPRLDSPLAQRRLEAAVEVVLAEKGFQPATATGEPDLILGYYVALDNKVDVQQVNSYYGGYYGWGRGAYWGAAYPSTTVRYYDQGTLILDVADAKLKQLVWRGTGQAEVHQESNPDRRQQRLEDAVRQIMKDFPPTPKK